MRSAASIQQAVLCACLQTHLHEPLGGEVAPWLSCSTAPTAKTGSSGGWQPSVRSASDTPSSAGSIAISPTDVEICHHPDGRAWVLGAGNFGRVSDA
jgi:hypothetical protein